MIALLFNDRCIEWTRLTRVLRGLLLAVLWWTVAADISIAATPPAISSLSPAGITAGSGSFTLTVNGSNFVPASAVNWNGAPLATSYVNATQLTATVPAGYITRIGTANVSVSTLPSGSPASGSSTFFIGSIISVTVSGFSSAFSSSGFPLYLFDDGLAMPPVGRDGIYSISTNSPTYNVTIPTQPPGLTCTVTNGGPQIGDSTNIWISCEPPGSTQPASNWTPLVNQPSQGVDAMLLLSDGSVIANVFGTTTWYRLTPASDGTYAKGTWAPIANSNCPHGDFAAQVLMDGRVFIAGGEAPEYAANGPPSGFPGCAGPGQSNTGVDTEIYDPVANTWTMATPPTTLIDPTQPTSFSSLCGTQAFADMISETLPDGSVLMAPVCPKSCGDTLIFNPKGFSPSSPGSGWSFGGTLANTVNTPASAPYTCNQQESSWVKLQDGSILTADPPASAGANETSERYVPSLHQWVPDTPLGFSLFDSEFGYNGDGEEGPAFVLPNGNALFIGGSPYTGLYTPAPAPPPGSPPASGTWTQSPLWASSPTSGPNGPATGGVPLSADDAPGAMMANGKILLALNYAATSADGTPTPAFFYEYDPSRNTYTEVAGPGNSGAGSPWTDCGGLNYTMLDLPDGTVLMESGCNRQQLYVYRSSGPALSQGQPIINSVTANDDGTFHVTGTTLNGITEGAAFGDDAQMATNFPLVRITSANGVVTYARTFNWSSTTVNPGASGSTDFALPAGNVFGSCFLQVVANGNASAAVPFTAPWCELLPSVHPVCDRPCGGAVVVWSSQILQGLGDPWSWLDEASLSLLPLNSDDADMLVRREQVLFSTQMLLQPESARWVLVESGAERAAPRSRSLMVGPTVELRAREGAEGGTTGGGTALPALMGTVSIPFQSRSGFRTSVRMVMFDARRGRWVDVASQKTDQAKHVVTARISGAGKYTVVVDIP